MKQIIIEDLPYDERVKYYEELRKRSQSKPKNGVVLENKGRYRGEQVNVTKFDDALQNHSVIKSEYLVKWKHDGNILYANTLLEDRYFKLYQEFMNDYFNFTTEIDMLRADVKLNYDIETEKYSVTNKAIF